MMDWIQLISSVIAITTAILTGMWSMLKFLLKDTHSQLSKLEIEQSEFRKRMDEYQRKTDRQYQETQNRMDGLYKILLDRTYGITKE